MSYSLVKIKTKIKQLSLMYAVDDFNLVLLGDASNVMKEHLDECERIEIKLPKEDYDRLKKHREFSNGILVGDFEYMTSSKFPGIVFFRGSDKYTGYVKISRCNEVYCYTEESNAKHNKVLYLIRKKQTEVRRAKQA